MPKLNKKTWYPLLSQGSMNSLTSLCILVLPNLDYCSCVWDPHFKTSTQVEAVQSFAAKLSTKRWSDSYESLLSRLDWEPLTSRHRRQKLLLCHRILLGSSIISPPTPILINSQHHTCPLCSDSYFSKFLFCLCSHSLEFLA